MTGPDGMSPGFFYKYWSIVGGDVIQVVRSFFETGNFVDKLTNTNIVLIPKKKCPTSMADLHPISLCNVLYKIISKVLANRLNKFIAVVISGTQNAFISFNYI